MAERTSDLRAGLTPLRRRWYVLVTAALLGLGAGVFYSTRVPVQLGSTALVLVSGGTSSAGDGDGAILTQVEIVRSTPVLSKAGSAVTPRLSPAEVKERLEVSAATSQLISIEAFSPRAGEAQALAQAVAQGYRDLLVDTAHSISGAIIKDLKDRQAVLTQQNTDLTRQILALDDRSAQGPRKSAEADRDAGLRAQLTSQQADIILRLNDVKSELAASGAITGQSTLASIVQPAAPATGPGSLPATISWAAAGAFLAAAAAAALVAFRARRDPRLRARDDVADAVGSSVLTDVRSRPQRSVAEWSTLFETYVAPPVDAWAFRQLLRALATLTEGNDGERSGARGPGRLEHPRSITVVTLGGDRRGLALAPQLAAFAASLSLTTRFVVATEHEAAASLRAACSADRVSDLRPGLRLDARSETTPRTRLAAVPDGVSFDDLMNVGPSNGRHPGQEEPEDLDGPAPRHSTPDLTIVLAVLDARAPSLAAVQQTAATVLAIAPGVGTRESLARLAVAVDDAGRGSTEWSSRTPIPPTAQPAGARWTSAPGRRHCPCASLAWANPSLAANGDEAMSSVDDGSRSDGRRSGLDRSQPMPPRLRPWKAASAWNIPDVAPDDPGDPGRPMAALVSFHYLRRAVRRHWIRCAVPAVLGLLLAAGFLLVSPTLPTATTTLLLSHDERIDPASAAATDVTLLSTHTVAVQTVHDLGLSMSPDALTKSVTPVPTGSSQVLQLTMTGPTDAEAVRRLTTFAAVYLQYRAEQVTTQTTVQIDSYDKRIDELKSGIDGLTTRIQRLVARGNGATNEISAAYADRQGLTSQLSEVQQLKQQAQLQQSSIVNASKVIDPPVALSGGRLKHLVLVLTSGLIVGLALGLALVVLKAILSDRLWLRVEVASALDAPVPLSVRRLAPLPWFLRPLVLLPWGRRERARREAARRVVAHVLQDSVGGAPRRPSIGVVCLGNSDQLRFGVIAAAASLDARGAPP